MAARKDASQSAPSRRRLGRGLTSLISTPVPVPTEGKPGADAPPPPAGSAPAVDVEVKGQADPVRSIPVAEIRPNASQPRQHFDEASLRELGASIRTAGLMQPIVVRPDVTAGGFELVVGERRWRAAKLIGLDRMPAVVREIDDWTTSPRTRSATAC